MEARMKINILLIIGLIFFIGGFAIFGSTFHTETHTAPCVDGDGDINLEGIMCEKTEGVCSLTGIARIIVFIFIALGCIVALECLFRMDNIKKSKGRTKTK